MKVLCQVYSSPRREETYLYVDKRRGLQDVPETLLASFGEPREVLSLLLTPERKLARVDAAAVLAAIQKQGFYLQLPPTPEEILSREKAGG